MELQPGDVAAVAFAGGMLGPWAHTAGSGVEVSLPVGVLAVAGIEDSLAASALAWESTAADSPVAGTHLAVAAAAAAACKGHIGRCCTSAEAASCRADGDPWWASFRRKESPELVVWTLHGECTWGRESESWWCGSRDHGAQSRTRCHGVDWRADARLKTTYTRLAGTEAPHREIDFNHTLASLLFHLYLLC
jgi:hypothetical protein